MSWWTITDKINITGTQNTWSSSQICIYLRSHFAQNLHEKCKQQHMGSFSNILFLLIRSWDLAFLHNIWPTEYKFNSGVICIIIFLAGELVVFLHGHCYSINVATYTFILWYGSIIEASPFKMQFPNVGLLVILVLYIPAYWMEKW